MKRQAQEVLRGAFNRVCIDTNQGGEPRGSIRLEAPDGEIIKQQEVHLDDT